MRKLFTGRPAATRFLALTALLTLGACAGGEAPQVDVQVAIELPDSVPLGEPLHIGFTWSPASDFDPPAEDYKIFVHMIDPMGNILWQDDHYPPQPTSQWRGDNAESYERWIYTPESLQAERLDFVVGLYSRDERAMIRDANGNWSEAVQVHSLDIRADDMSGIPVYMEGWHALEEVEDPEPKKWRWSEDTARAVFTNPGTDGILHMRAHGPFDELGAQTVTLRIGEEVIATVMVETADEVLERIPIPAAVMGDEDWVEVTLSVDPVLVPKDIEPDSEDDRKLGLQVFLMYLSAASS